MIKFPRIVLIEPDAFESVSKVIDESGLLGKCGIFCDTTVRRLYGERLGAMTKSNIIPIDTIEREKLDNIKPDFDFAIALGGGRTIDATKYIASKIGKPWISFPTIPSHTGIISANASLEENGKRISVPATPPIAVIADLNILSSAPYRFIASGCGDLIAVSSAIEDWKLAAAVGKERFNEVIAELALLGMRSIIAHTKEIKTKSIHGMQILVWSLLCTGFAMTIHGSSRPASGSEHAMSHALDSLGSKALHGEQVALCTIISTYLQNRNWKKTKKLLESFGIPTTAKEIGIPENSIIRALVMAKNVRDRYTILNEKHIDENQARRILKEVGII